MNPAQRFLIDIEPLAEGDTIVRQPKRASGGHWWKV
jgi:hypothetical protein